MTLQPLREELELLPGPRLADGQPTWTLHDPVRNLFFQIDWPSFEILSRWSMREPERIAATIRAETTLDLDRVDVERLGAFLQENQLNQPPSHSARQFAESWRRQRSGFSRWLIHNYLFLRIPLLRPDALLARWTPRLEFLFSRTFLQLTVLAGIAGLFGVFREWGRFSATLVDLLTWQGVTAYAVTLVAVKALHELGHGITAKRFGCRVPTMGVALLVLWPVAYTDTNDVWKLTRRDQRLKVAAAGVATELMIAAWATLAWGWLPTGWPTTAAFLLSTTTWVSTVVVNASPFMRFDGYFFLSDALRLPNLHARSFALARWHLREALFGLGEPPPEHFARPRRVALILFAYATWLYRLILFLGIALLVYHFFVKVIGILLFAVEIVWFVAIPVGRELRAWRIRWPQIRASRRARYAAAALIVVVAVFGMPWPTRVITSGLLQPEQVFVIYAPPHARITRLPHADQSRVAAGELLIAMESPDLQVRDRELGALRERLAWQSASAGFDARQRKDWQVLNEELATADAETQTLIADTARYQPVAPYSGTLRDLDPDLAVGDWVSEDDVLARLVRDGTQQVVTYVSERDIHRIAPGDRALFISDGLGGPTATLEVLSVDRDASHTLNEPELAALFGGHVLVREKDGVLYPERAVYRVVLQLADETVAPGFAWRGTVSIAGTWEAPGSRFVRTAANVMWRELGF